MSETGKVVLDWIRSEFIAEQAAGFPRLSRVPDTRVLCFLDHYATLSTAEQESLREVVVSWSANQWLLPPPNPVAAQYAEAMALPHLNRGVRYSGVNLLAGLAKDVGLQGLAGFYAGQGLSGLALTPSPTLLPNLSDLRPLTPAALRRKVDRALGKLFAPQLKDLGSEIWQYDGELSGTRLTIEIRYSGKMLMPQLAYTVRVARDGFTFLSQRRVGFESILGVGMGYWNYLTVENVDRSLDLLGELLVWLAKLPLYDGLLVRRPVAH